MFARQANGQVAPLRVLEGQKTGISRSLHGIYVDIPNDEVVIPSNVAGAILVFGRTQSGNTPPRRMIQGSRTHLHSPQGVAVDNKHDELVVSNDTRQSILVFERAANGNVAPVREIIGPKTGITNPQGIVVDPVHDRLEVPDVVVLVKATLVGDKVHVRPAEGETVSDNVTVPVNPLMAFTETAEVPAEPTTTGTVIGLAVTVKSGAAVTL